MAKMSIKNVVLDAASELYHEDWLFSVLEWAAQIALSARPALTVEDVERIAKDARRLGYSAMGLVNTPKTRNAAAVGVNHLRDEIIALIGYQETPNTEGE